MKQNGNESPFFEGDDERSAPPGRALVPAQRHDGFTPERRRLFLATLRETGCVQDACRVAGISDSAAYKARKRDPELGELWRAALSRAGTDIETLAWHRAVVGVEEPVWAYGKLVGTRRRRDDRLFRMLVQASDPNRYGGPGYFTRRALEQRIRAEIEEEQRQLIDADEADEVRRRLADKLQRLSERMVEEGGYYRTEDGGLVPVGYVKAAEPEDPAPGEAEGPVPGDVEGPVPSEGEGPVRAACEEPVPSEDEGPDAGEDEGPDPGEAGWPPEPGLPCRGAGWTESEPDWDAGDDGDDSEESRFSADFRPRGPRISQL